uniref:Uncharacterized protein n=1 Tax=Sphaerodactylus townsendi TaxID=933632 RepID=A0ACB8EYT2_9SAUR
MEELKVQWDVGKQFNVTTQLYLRPAKLIGFPTAFAVNTVFEASTPLCHTSNMGNGHSTGSFDVPDILEAHQVKTEGDPEAQPASANQIVLQQEEADKFPLPAEETGAEELQEDGPPLSLSQSAASDKSHPIGQTCELNIVTPPAEHSSENADYISPQVPPEAANELEAETAFILSEDESLDAELLRTVEELRCLAESALSEQPSEMTTWSSAEKEQDSEKQTTIQSKSDDGSFQMVAELHPFLAASEMGEEHSSMTTHVTKPSEAQGSAAAELMTAEMTPLPAVEAQAGQNEGCTLVDAQITEGAEHQTILGIPEEANSEFILAQQTLDTPEKPPASNVVEQHADTKSIGAIENDEDHLTTDTKSLAKEHPAPAEPLLDNLAESSSIELDEAKEPSLMKEMDEACSDPAAAEMTEAQVIKLDECQQPILDSCPEVTLALGAQEAEPVVTTDVGAQIQGSPDVQKDSAKDLEPERKQEVKFSKTFCLCCSQCVAGEDEANAGK